MGHEIMGERFVSRTMPAWHGLGQMFDADEQLSASEAVARVAGDVTVRLFPIYYDLNQNNGAGVARHTVDDQFAVVRMPTVDQPKPVEYGIVGKDWKAESYVDLARALDKLSKKYRVETAGLLKDGALCFVSLRGSDWDVAGDPMESYFVANLSLQPGTGHRVMHTPIRVVCWNTNTMAQAQSSINLSVPHNADAKQQLGVASDLVVRFTAAQKKTKETCEAFAARALQVAEAEEIFAAAYPEPEQPKKLQLLRGALGSDEAVTSFKKDLDPDALAQLLKAEDSFEALLERRHELRQVARERYAQFEPTRLRGTAWAAYNAVTEVADWREGPEGSVAASTLFGSRAKEKQMAFVKTLEIVQAN
jgi:hypothetical protein